jgi:hypothetical protein
MCRGSPKACTYYLYVDFSIPLYAEWHISQGFIYLEGMRFCGQVPNSHVNKSLKSLDPYLLLKMAFLAPKTLCIPQVQGFYFI